MLSLELAREFVLRASADIEEDMDEANVVPLDSWLRLIMNNCLKIISLLKKYF